MSFGKSAPADSKEIQTYNTHLKPVDSGFASGVPQ